MKQAVEIGRIGMANTLAYQVPGPLDDGPRVYEAIYRAGSDQGKDRIDAGNP